MGIAAEPAYPVAVADVPESDYSPSALPSRGARALAFVAILLAGLCGGLIGYAFFELQCTGNCTAVKGIGGLVGAVIFAAGVGVVSILALRAMAEWRVVEARNAANPDASPRTK